MPSAARAEQRDARASRGIPRTRDPPAASGSSPLTARARSDSRENSPDRPESRIQSRDLSTPPHPGLPGLGLAQDDRGLGPRFQQATVDSNLLDHPGSRRSALAILVTVGAGNANGADDLAVRNNGHAAFHRYGTLQAQHAHAGAA